MSFIRENKNYLVLLLVMLGLGIFMIDQLDVSIKIMTVGVMFYTFFLLGIISIKPLMIQNKWWENIFYIFILSAFFGPALLNYNIGPFSLFPFRILFPLIVLIMLYLYFKDLVFTWNQLYTKKVLLLFVFWLTYALTSLIWVKSLSQGVMDLIFLLMGIGIIVFMVSFANKQKKINTIYSIWMVSFLLILGMGVINHFFHIHLPISRISTANPIYSYIPTSVFVNENDFASFISLSIFFVLSAILYYRSKFIKFIGLMLILISIYMLDITSSRANILAVFIGLGFWFVFLTETKSKIKLIFWGALGSGITSLLFFEKVNAIFNAIYQLVLSLIVTSGSDETSTDIRLNLLKNSFIFLENTLGFGVGTGNSEFFMKNYGVYPTGNIVNVHNWWVEILVNYGVVIFTLYCLIYLYLVKELFIINKDISEQSQLKLVSVSLLLAMVVFPLSSVSPSSQIALNYFWVLYGFVIAFINYYRVNNQEELK
ncbi:O-antigen ligase family protein [Fictibacillus nanhaiensis]|uniref:O-antigen ligase family protein n=1 Tax=Fictibacillus nanhaiensis TaxID=742169 RepID=A0ABS2ZMU4_9BACL|nr:O-antigen ligase family protein [Fictibacillus nanhaiensis]